MCDIWQKITVWAESHFKERDTSKGCKAKRKRSIWAGTLEFGRRVWILDLNRFEWKACLSPFLASDIYQFYFTIQRLSSFIFKLEKIAPISKKNVMKRFPDQPVFNCKSSLFLLLLGKSTKVSRSKILCQEISLRINSHHQMKSVLTFEPKKMIFSELMNVPCNIWA